MDKIKSVTLVPSDIEYMASDEEYFVKAIAEYLDMFRKSPYWKKYLEEKYGKESEDNDINDEL